MADIHLVGSETWTMTLNMPATSPNSSIPGFGLSFPPFSSFGNQRMKRPTKSHPMTHLSMNSMRNQGHQNQACPFKISRRCGNAQPSRGNSEVVQPFKPKCNSATPVNSAPPHSHFTLTRRDSGPLPLRPSRRPVCTFPLRGTLLRINFTPTNTYRIA